eukprot:s4105_g4.t1
MRAWLSLEMLCALALADLGAARTYHTYLDLSRRPGLRRTVARPDGTLLKLALVDNCTGVKAVAMDMDETLIGEVDVSDADTQARLLTTELEVHGLTTWHFPDEDLLVWDRLLQVGDLRDSNEEDPARLLVQRHGLQGMVAAGSRPSESPETWRQGPPRSAIDLSLEGGTELAQQLGEWAQVDVLRMDQGLPGSCMLLRGLLIGGLSARMILSFTNSQFPPPLRYVGLAEELPESLQGCSLSYLQDILKREGFRLQLLSGPYAAFLHEDLLTESAGAGGIGISAPEIDEFECYRSSRIWGFEPDFPIDVVRDWFFGIASSPAASQEVLSRSFGNVSQLVSHLPMERKPGYLLYSFARDKKKDAWSGEGTPGPGYYSMDYANALVCASAASMGTAAARSHCSETRRSLKKEKSDPNTHLHVMEAWVTSTAAGPSPRIGFGTETREAQVSDLELLRACPESRYGSGPGLVYNPDYRIPGTGECVQNRLAEALLATSLAAWPAAWEERLDKWHRLRISTTIRRDVHVATASDVMFTDLLNEG